MKNKNEFAGGTFGKVLEEGPGFRVVSDYKHPSLSHGSPTPIKSFDTAQGSGQFCQGLYLAHSPDIAKFHAQGMRQGNSGQRAKTEGRIYNGSLHAPRAVLVHDPEAFGQHMAGEHENVGNAFSDYGDHSHSKVTKHWGEALQDHYGVNAIVYHPSETDVHTPFTQTLAMEGSKFTQPKKKIAKSEPLDKAYLHPNKGWLPESNDSNGLEKPDDPSKIKHDSSTLGPVWKLNDRLKSIKEKSFVNDFQNSPTRHKLSDEGKSHLARLANQIASDPDRHVIATGLPNGEQALRLRHLHSALLGRGASISENNGLIISVDRHSKNKNSDNGQDNWHYSEKGLKYLGKDPMSKSSGGKSHEFQNMEHDEPGREDLRADSKLKKSQSGRVPEGYGLEQQLCQNQHLKGHSGRGYEFSRAGSGEQNSSGSRGVQGVGNIHEKRDRLSKLTKSSESLEKLAKAIIPEAKYKISQKGNQLVAEAHIGRKKIGSLSGRMDGPVFLPGDASVHTEHQGQGHGKILYDTLIAHAKANHGATYIHGSTHSPAANSIHKEMSKKHGNVNIKSRKKDGAWDYEYSLKSDNMNKSEPLQKDIVDFKKKKAEKEAKMTAEKRALYESLKNKTTNRSTDQKIVDALRAQGKDPSDYTKDRWSSQGSGIMDQPTEHEQKLADFKERHQKVIERQKNDEYAAAKNDPYGQMKMRYEDKPEIIKYIEENESKPSKEPYYGNPTFHGLGYYTPPSKDPQPYPHYNVTPNGVLGHEVSDFGHDPFMWMDTKYGATKKVLQEHKDKPLDIHTRSDLIGHDEYMPYLNPKKHKINMHVLSGNSHVNSILSPGSPSTKRVLTAAQKLHDAGHDVTVVHDNIPGLALRYPQNGLSPLEVARHVKENHPGLKFKVNEIPEGEKHTNFMNNVHKVLGRNDDESE